MQFFRIARFLYGAHNTRSVRSMKILLTDRIKLYSGVQHSLQECKGVWWMPRLQEAMKDVIWLR